MSIAVEVMIPMPHVHIMGGGHCGSLGHHPSRLGMGLLSARHPKTYVSEDKFHALERSSAPWQRASGETASTGLLGHLASRTRLGRGPRTPGGLLVLNQTDVALDGKHHPRIDVIGSRSKWQAFEEAAREQGVPQALLDQVICPSG